MTDLSASKLGAAARGGVGEPIAHDSAHLHVSGEAGYTDDLPELRGTLHAAFALSRHAHARILGMRKEAVLRRAGVVRVLTAADIPGENNFGAIVKDDPILAAGEVLCFGQPLALVIAENRESALRAARALEVDYEPLAAILDIEEALAKKSFVLPPKELARGDARAAILSAPNRLSGEFRIGGQEHFYLEGQIAYAVPMEGGRMHVYSSTQYPNEAQEMVAKALGLARAEVLIECRRMGGGFGGKETQAVWIACAAALAARATGRPVKLRMDRDDDMLATGKRHDFLVRYEAGFERNGRIAGIEFMLASRCGYSADLSGPVNDRAMMNADNCYFIENVLIQSFRCRTHTQSATALRGFGGPQGVMAMEAVIDEIARALAIDPLAVRNINLYGKSERNITHYGQTVEDNIAPELIEALAKSAAYAVRRDAIRRWNAASPVLKRGIALTPVKFGISYTAAYQNQGGALIQLYTDGTVLLNHGGTEMGQGLFVKVAQVVATEFGLDVERIHVSATDTSKVPNASATAASSGTDLNGMAAQAAARELRARLSAFIAAENKCAPDSVRFESNSVFAGDAKLSFAELVRKAYLGRVSLSATGFYSTPKIAWSSATMTGRPYYYFAYGAGVTEVAIDTLTGETRILRADLLHDVGRSLNPAIDLGQIEGAYVQGVGWLTTEELFWDERGELRTHAPSTYKIPVASDVPRDFRVSLWESGANTEETIFRSKAVGEPPLMLAVSAFHAIRDAIAAAADYAVSPRLSAPATPEAVLFSVRELRSRAKTRRLAAARGTGVPLQACP